MASPPESPGDLTERLFASLSLAGKNFLGWRRHAGAHLCPQQGQHGIGLICNSWGHDIGLSDCTMPVLG